MAEYNINSSDTRSFVLTHDKERIGEVNYKSWFSMQAEMQLPHQRFIISPKGFWGTTIELRQQEQVFLHFKLQWSGNILITSLFDTIEEHFILKQKGGLFKYRFVLETESGEELVTIVPDFKWKKMTFDYAISTSDEFERKRHKNIFLLTAIHCSNYYMNMMSSNAAM